MSRQSLYRIALLVGGFGAIWLFLRYLLPIFLPFALGLLLAFAAEPAVSLGVQRLKLPRWASTGIGVTATLLLLVGFVGFLGATVVKELGALAKKLPDLQSAATETAQRVRVFLEDAASRTPQGIQPLMVRSIDRLFSSGSELLEQATVGLPGKLSGVLSKVPDGALGIGATILSGFMFSARLPSLKQTLSQKFPVRLRERILPTLRRSKTALVGWLKAQLKLSGVTYGIVTLGFLLLGIPYAPLWAAAVAAVDAVPLLGTGTILLPWALVCLVRRAHLRSVGLLCIYAAAFLTRTVLEPRLVGRHLGLDPLVTLVFLYLGYRFWGLGGMILAPMLVAALTAATLPQTPTDNIR